MTRWTMAFAGFAGLALVACGGGDGGGESTGGGGGEATGGGEETGGGEGDLAMYEGPVSGDPTAGGDVFANFCAGCHPGSGPDLHGEGDSAAEVRMKIRNGYEGMPAFSADVLSDGDMENVLAHLQSEFGMFQ